MPQGAALSERGKLIANPAVLHARIEQGTDGLVRTATGLVRDLTGTEGSSQTVQSSSTGKGSSTWIWIVVGVAVAAALGALAFALARIRRRKPA
jgi:LPXTG-motif cell wall-anchored protein